MALKTYPNTPEEEAARINAKAGVQPGEEPAITAEQVASNRKLNESLTNALGFGEGGSGFSLSENPFSKLVSGITESVKEYIPADQGATLPTSIPAADKEKLNAKLDELSGSVGSGLNGATAGAFAAGGNPFADASGLIKSGMGSAGGVVDTATNVDPTGAGLAAFKQAAGGLGLGAGVSGLTDASALATKFPGAGEIKGSLEKLTGGDLAGGVKGLAGSIAKAAGSLNDILSLKRGANLPSGAELFNQTGQEIKLDANPANDWRVRINAQFEYFDSKLFALLANTGGVVFPVLPQISMTTSASYNEISPTHNNYPFMSYKNSQVEDISISGQFPAETETDAAYWLAATTFFKTATKMFYGQGELAGNPPIVCYLSGYGQGVFKNVPIVVKSFSIDFPDDVNYIKCTKFGDPTWVPILSTVNLTVKPLYNRRNMRQFNLKDYANGNMTGPSGVGYL
jgi:hypothetical protein